jgi:hypothetical protein
MSAAHADVGRRAGWCRGQVGAYEVEQNEIVFNTGFESCNPIPIQLDRFFRRSGSGLDFHTTPALETMPAS